MVIHDPEILSDVLAYLSRCLTCGAFIRANVVILGHARTTGAYRTFIPPSFSLKDDGLAGSPQAVVRVRRQSGNRDCSVAGEELGTTQDAKGARGSSSVSLFSVHGHREGR